MVMDLLKLFSHVKTNLNQIFYWEGCFCAPVSYQTTDNPYRGSLEQNEYVELGLSVDDKNVTQAVNVTGILGGSLLCDVQHDRPARGGGATESGDSEGSFRTPKYHQRRGRRFRGGSRNHGEGSI